MEPEITGGIKNVPFISPSSPPPIVPEPLQNDYDEFGIVCSDSEDMFDITGLSQKLNLCEKNAKSSELHTLNSDNEIRVTEIQRSNFDNAYIQSGLACEDNIDLSRPDSKYLEKHSEVSENIHEKAKHISALSPPPLNCISLPSQETHFIGTLNFPHEVETGNDDSFDCHSHISTNILPEEKNKDDKNHNSLYINSTNEYKDNSSPLGTCSNDDIPPKILDFEEHAAINDFSRENFDNPENGQSAHNTLVSDITGPSINSKSEDYFPQELISSDEQSSKRNLRSNEAEGIKNLGQDEKVSLTSAVHIKGESEIVEQNSTSNTKTKVPSEETHFFENEFTEFKSVTLPSSTIIEDSTIPQNDEHSKMNNLCNHDQFCIVKQEGIAQINDDDDEFGDFTSNEYPCVSRLEPLNKVSKDNDLRSKPTSDDNDEFGDFVISDTFTTNPQVVTSYLSTSPQTEANSEKNEEFGEFVVDAPSSFVEILDVSEATPSRRFTHKDVIVPVSQVKNEALENSKDDSRSVSLIPIIGVVSECKDSYEDRDGGESSILAASNNDDDEFGEFNCPETSAGLQLEFSDDDDDFKSGSVGDANTKVPLESALEETNAFDNKFTSLMLRCIPLPTLDPSNENASNINVVKISEIVEGDAFIWHHLEDIDSSYALKLSWPTSHINKLFMSSLNVDARNILFGHKWSSTIPVFAQNLSFSPLTPAKPCAISKQWGLDANLTLNSNPPSVLLPEESSLSSNKTESNCNNEQKVIPPAQFDWSSSGLTNPLDASASFSSLFDYQVPVPHTKGGVGKPQGYLSSLEEEILNSFSSDVTTLTKEETKTHSSSTPLFEKILRESNCGPSRTTELSSLPPEVRSIVESLPDLSFMRSKVLMFPLREVLK